MVPGAYFSARGGSGGAVPVERVFVRAGDRPEEREKAGEWAGARRRGSGITEGGAGPAQSQRPVERVPGP